MSATTIITSCLNNEPGDLGFPAELDALVKRSASEGFFFQNTLRRAHDGRLLAIFKDGSPTDPVLGPPTSEHYWARFEENEAAAQKTSDFIAQVQDGAWQPYSRDQLSSGGFVQTFATAKTLHRIS